MRSEDGGYEETRDRFLVNETDRQRVGLESWRYAPGREPAGCRHVVTKGWVAAQTVARPAITIWPVDRSSPARSTISPLARAGAGAFCPPTPEGCVGGTGQAFGGLRNGTRSHPDIRSPDPYELLSSCLSEPSGPSPVVAGDALIPAARNNAAGMFFASHAW